MKRAVTAIAATAGLLALVTGAFAQTETFTNFVLGSSAGVPTTADVIPCIENNGSSYATQRCTIAALLSLISSPQIIAALGYTPMRGSNNLSELTNTSTARSNLGVLTITSTPLLAINNLGDVLNTSTARSNLGLGFAATTTLTTKHILVGNAANIATDVALSGDLSIVSGGQATVQAIQTTTVSGTTGSGSVVFNSAPTLTSTVTLGGLNQWVSLFNNGTRTLAGTALGAANTALVSNGAAAIPTFQAIPISIAGTTNQTNVSSPTGAVVISIPAAFQAPGYVQANGSTAPAGEGIYHSTTTTMGFAAGGVYGLGLNSNGQMFGGPLPPTDVVTTVGTAAPAWQVHTNGNNGIGTFAWTNDNTASSLVMTKSRGTVIGTKTAVQVNDQTGRIIVNAADGTNFVNNANLRFPVDGAVALGVVPTAFQVELAATTTGTLTTRFQLSSNGAAYLPGINTTASAANVFVDNASSPANQILRVTSSMRYKKLIGDVPLAEARKILGLRPIQFYSLSTADDPQRVFEGLSAEEVAKDFPQFANFMRDENGVMIPDGVQYDRIAAVPMLMVLQDQEKRLAELEAKASNDNSLWGTVRRAVGF